MVLLHEAVQPAGDLDQHPALQTIQHVELEQTKLHLDTDSCATSGKKTSLTSPFWAPIQRLVRQSMKQVCRLLLFQ